MTAARRIALLLAALASAAGAAAAGLQVVKGKYCPHRAVTPHFVIECSLPAETAKEYAELSERAYARLHKIFPLRDGEKVWRERCYVFLFRNRGEFVAFAASVHGKTAAQSGGYTTIDPHKPIIVLFLHGNDHTRLKQTLIHEMTHVFLQLFRKEVKIATWLHEGFAQYFEFQHKPEQSRLALSKQIAKALVAQRRAAPLSKFWHTYFPPTDVASYAQAWSLIDFMASTKALRRKTGQFILAVKQGQSQEQALKAAFGVTLGQFEALWKRYVLETY